MTNCYLWLKERMPRFACFLLGHWYMCDWETTTTLGFVTQRLRDMRCIRCGKSNKASLGG